MSSAYMSTFELEIPIGRSLMYSENSIGPKIDPCGTPRASTSASDSEPLMQQLNEGVVSKETVVLRRWGSSIQKFGFINGVDNVNWPPYRDSKS